MNKLKDIFTRKDKNKENQSIGEIGLPTNVVQTIHVSKNQLTGDLEGLPKAWTRLLKSQITEEEQNDHPDAGRLRSARADDLIHMIHSSQTCKLFL